MARITLHLGTTGLATAYAVLIDRNDGRFWDATGGALAVYADADWADYAVPLAEVGSSRIYGVDVPAALPAGNYDVLAFTRAGGTPAIGDTFRGGNEYRHAGAAVGVEPVQTGDLFARLNTALELDGSVYRFTANALEQAPMGGGGGDGDATLANQETILARLGIPSVSLTADVAAVRAALLDLAIIGEVSGSATTTGFAAAVGLSATNDFYNGSVACFVEGTLKGIARRITDYTGSSRTFAFAVPFPVAPSVGDQFIIVGRIDEESA